MNKLNILSVLISLSFIHVTLVTCFKPKDYCNQKYSIKCKQNAFEFHMGCTNLTKIREADKLVQNDRVALTKYFNEIRNQIASNKNIANMKQLIWNEEYEYLAKQAIERQIEKEDACYWTENSKVFPSELVVAKSAIFHDGSWAITAINGVSHESQANPPVLTEAGFSKINKINYLLDDEKNQLLRSNYSAVYDPPSNFIGCAWMTKRNLTYDFKQIRCIINGKQNLDNNDFVWDKPCSKCELKVTCSKEFKNLCSSSDKFGINFWLVCFVVVLGFNKFFK